MDQTTIASLLKDDPDASPPMTVVNFVSDTEPGGVLIDFARTGGIAVTNVMMADFAKRASEEFAKDKVPEQSLTARRTYLSSSWSDKSFLVMAGRSLDHLRTHQNDQAVYAPNSP